MSHIQFNRFRNISTRPSQAKKRRAAGFCKSERPIASRNARPDANAETVEFQAPQTDLRSPGKHPLSFSGLPVPMFKRIRPILERWLAKRNRDARIRELEGLLRQLDAHTLDDIGFNLMRPKVHHPDAHVPNALVQAVETLSEHHMIDLDGWYCLRPREPYGPQS